MMNKKVVVFALYVFLVMHASLLMADQSDVRGKVLKFNGDVEVINNKGEKRFVNKVDETLNEMDTLVTQEGARVVVQFNDGALSVLDEKSRLRVEQSSWFSYLGGKVYFTFNRFFGEQRRVKTRAATIGIRGTTFIISENSEQNGESLALKEGLLRIESTGPAFEIHKKKISDEFERYRQEPYNAKEVVQDEFSQYKQQARREFVEYRRNFTLRANQVINLSGYRVDETVMTSDNEKDFAAFESEAEDLIKAFRDKVGK